MIKNDPEFFDEDGNWKPNAWLRQYLRQLMSMGPRAIEEDVIYMLKHTSKDFMDEVREEFEFFYEEAAKEKPIRIVDQRVPAPMRFYPLTYPVPRKFDVN